MNKEQEQLIKLIINNTQTAQEIEAVHKRCCIYFGIDQALESCQAVIDFAVQSGISLLESFRLQVEVEELSIKRADK